MCWQRGHLLQDRSPALSGQHPPSQSLETTSLLLPPYRPECQQPLPPARVLDLGPALSPFSPDARNQRVKMVGKGGRAHRTCALESSPLRMPSSCLPGPHLEAENQGRQTTEGQLTSSPTSSMRTVCLFSSHLP